MVMSSKTTEVCYEPMCNPVKEGDGCVEEREGHGCVWRLFQSSGKRQHAGEFPVSCGVAGNKLRIIFTGEILL